MPLVFAFEILALFINNLLHSENKVARLFIILKHHKNIFNLIKIYISFNPEWVKFICNYFTKYSVKYYCY